ncbi:hypothetical protein MtrunA17_Chr6g0485401 [Medicago truncatula]|uniref:Transmembrane protein, putative n=1 Tax=Medicago truncatula TaxID=3880 RepID=A0A072UMK0_MEDTR|nr:transmembrane protein, putative [Medicago truncatula]RHN52885.1 hypothetical protein MtrunA17_Chr6g0485401 [Medicago truncatula]
MEIEDIIVDVGSIRVFLEWVLNWLSLTLLSHIIYFLNLNVGIVRQPPKDSRSGLGHYAERMDAFPLELRETYGLFLPNILYIENLMDAMAP